MTRISEFFRFRRSFRLVSLLLAVAAPTGLASAEDACAKLFRRLAEDARRPPLTDADLEKAAEERVCIKSFPWPNSIDLERDDPWNQPAKVLERARDDFARLDQKYQARFASKRFEFLGLDYGERAKKLVKKYGLTDGQEIRYMTFRLGGGSTKQLDLYASMLQAKAYCAERRYADALALAREIRNRYGMTLRRYDFDRAEEHSYMSEQTLTNFLGGFEYLARLKTVGTSPAERLALAADYLDHTEALENVTGVKIGPGDLDGGVISLVERTELPLGGNSADVLANLKKLPALLGFSKSADETVLYLQGTSTHALRIRDGSAELLSPGEAASALRDYCRQSVRAQSTAKMDLFNVLPLGDRVEIDLPGESLTLSREDYDKVREGQPLPDNHPLSRSVAAAGEKSLVSFTNPLGIKPGRYQEESDAFVFGLSRAYPKMRVHRDPLSDRTGAMVEALDNQAVRGDDVIAVIAKKSLANVKDGNVILNMTDENGVLSRAKIPVIPFDEAGDATWDGPRQMKVIVITGHSDEELVKFVHALGKAGWWCPVAVE